MKNKKSMNRKRRNSNSKHSNSLDVTVLRSEANFREQEKDLRDKDLEIQAGMIRFSTFLQDNEKKKKKADNKIKEEENLIDVKVQEITRKKEYLKILEEKSKRIELKVVAMKKYETYLEEVRECNPDEY